MAQQRIVLILFLMILFSGCVYKSNNHPLIVRASYLKDNSKIHVVQSGDTIYSIAWRYDRDFKELALLNGLPEPYGVYEGQKIYIKKEKVNQSFKQVQKINSDKLPSYEVKSKKRNNGINKNIPSEIYSDINKSKFIFWPAKGQLIKRYSKNSKGIEIAGKVDDPVYAVGNGIVVYSGNGLRGYGNLLIIKHNSIILSAYAYNSRILVKEGDHVIGGQKIALMGMNFKKPVLHFEIRKLGKPLDPLLYLPK